MLSVETKSSDLKFVSSAQQCLLSELLPFYLDTAKFSKKSGLHTIICSGSCAAALMHTSC